VRSGGKKKENKLFIFFNFVFGLRIGMVSPPLVQSWSSETLSSAAPLVPGGPSGQGGSAVPAAPPAGPAGPELELLYDPELNCYFDPVTSNYYVLA
jgi:hypothetical protein